VARRGRPPRGGGQLRAHALLGRGQHRGPVGPGGPLPRG
jgi:hypothetical protein